MSVSEDLRADKAHTHCPRLEGLAPWLPIDRSGLVQILMN